MAAFENKIHMFTMEELIKAKNTKMPDLYSATLIGRFLEKYPEDERILDEKCAGLKGKNKKDKRMNYMSNIVLRNLIRSKMVEALIQYNTDDIHLPEDKRRIIRKTYILVADDEMAKNYLESFKIDYQEKLGYDDDTPKRFYPVINFNIDEPKIKESILRIMGEHESATLSQVWDSMVEYPEIKDTIEKYCDEYNSQKPAGMRNMSPVLFLTKSIPELKRLTYITSEQVGGLAAYSITNDGIKFLKSLCAPSEIEFHIMYSIEQEKIFVGGKEIFAPLNSNKDDINALSKMIISFLSAELMSYTADSVAVVIGIHKKFSGVKIRKELSLDSIKYYTDILSDDICSMLNEYVEKSASLIPISRINKGIQLMGDLLKQLENVDGSKVMIQNMRASIATLRTCNDAIKRLILKNQG